MHYLKSDISEFNFGNSSVLVVQYFSKSFIKLKIVVVHKLPNFDASVFDDFFYYNIYIEVEINQVVS